MSLISLSLVVGTIAIHVGAVMQTDLPQTPMEVDDAECRDAGNAECSASAPGSALMQLGKRSTGVRVHSSPDAAGKTTIGTDFPTFLVDKMILPDPWKCPFYNHDWRVCEIGVEQAGLTPGYITEAGRKTHEFLNTLRVHLPVGTVPCCPTAPFCSSPKCSESFLAASKVESPPPVCTKRSGAENFAYMTGQEEWPAYFAFCGGYPFDVHKHWDVLNVVMGCPSGKCNQTETFDLVIDLGSNFGMVTEELTNRHFAKSYIMVDVAPFAGPDFHKRIGNKTWREDWFQQQMTHRPGEVVPEYEFHQYGLSNREGGTIDPCVAWGYNGGVACPVEMANVDSFIPAKLTPDFQDKFEQAQSAFIKIDVEGWDQLAVQGMPNLLSTTRGVHADGSTNHLVNFLMLEYAPKLMGYTKKDKQSLLTPTTKYNLKTMVSLLEEYGFEVFLTGPRYLPLTHGSWDEQYGDWFDSLVEGAPHCPKGDKYPKFKDVACPSAICDCQFATDLFAMRASHPKAAEIKLALGACAESKDFSEGDPQYDMSPMEV